MSWTENQWLKPAWMGGGNDFVTKYQDKFAKIGEKFAPEIKHKNAKDDGPNGIRLSGSEDDILKMVSIFRFAFEDNMSFNKDYKIIYDKKWKSIKFGKIGDRVPNTFHKEYLNVPSGFYPIF